MGSPETPHFLLFSLSDTPEVHRSASAVQQLPPKSIPTHDRDIDRYAIAGFVLLVVGIALIVLAARSRRSAEGADKGAEPPVTASPAVERLKRDVRGWRSSGNGE
jgi:hypothetical protein